MRKKYFVTLTEAERMQLKELITKGKAPAYKIRHAHILLKAEEGWSDEAIARSFGCNVNTSRNVRQRFVEQGFEAALARKQRETPPRARIFDGKAEAHLIALRCSPPPEGRRRWTLHLLADKLVELRVVEKVSYETVRRTLKKMP